MKKTLLLLIGFFSAQVVLAQAPYILQSDMMKIGSTFVYHLDTLTVAYPGTGGQNKVWDYMNIKSHLTDTTKVVPVSQTKHKDMFAGSSFAFTYQNGEEADYFTVNATGYYDDSYQTTQTYSSNIFPSERYEIVAPYNPKAKFLALPATYGTSWKDSAVAKVPLKGQSANYFDSLRIVDIQHNSNTCDAWGILKTPAGTYPKALRQMRVTAYIHYTETKKNGVWTKSTLRTYNDTVYIWWASGEEGPVFELIKRGGDDNIQSEYLSAYVTRTNPTGLADNFYDNKKVSIYPNPARETFTVKGVTKIISLATATGEETNYSSSETAEGILVHVNDLARGIYLLRVQSGESSKTLKVSIVE